MERSDGRVTEQRTLVLGLGNELAAEDAVGIIVARIVNNELRRAEGPDVEVVESSSSGLALLEVLAGHDRAIVIDAIATGTRPPGSIVEMGIEEVGGVTASSTHQAGLPELAAVADRLGLAFPAATRVFAVEVVDPYTLGGPMSDAVSKAVPQLVFRVREQLAAWAAEDRVCTSTA